MTTMKHIVYVLDKPLNEGEEGKLVISEWLATKKGWL
jgi:hypothetical protein